MDNSDLIDSPDALISSSQLSCGDWVEAYYQGSLVHYGKVTDIAPRDELFWIQDVLTGSRRLLDASEFEIRKDGVARSASPYSC